MAALSLRRYILRYRNVFKYVLTLFQIYMPFVVFLSMERFGWEIV